MYRTPEEKKKKAIKEWIYSLVIVLAFVSVLRGLLFGVVIVKGVSMEPTLFHDEVIIVNKQSYLFSEPEKGEIVVCDYIDGTETKKMVKRIIGVPGDVIDVQLNDDYKYEFYINDQLIEEDYIKEEIDQKGNIEYPFTVEENNYFVMGDNRNSSNDSRNLSTGTVLEEDIMGEVILKAYPFEDIEFY